jgi:hypothetical protein
MALTAIEQRYLDFALSAMPTWFTSDERQQEFLNAAAKGAGAVEVVIASWFANTLILQAEGPTGFDPDWTNQHAVDRGTSRQAGESTAALRDRIRNIPDAVTAPTVLSAAQSVVDAEGIVGAVHMVELRQNQAYFGEYASDSGVGGEFIDEGAGVFSFVPDTQYQGILQPPSSTHFAASQLVFSGAASGANDGTVPITGVSGDGATFANAGVAEVDATVTWTLQKRDIEGNVRDGHRAFMNRGYRMHGSPRSKFILILPYGCTSGTRAGILEMLRQKKGAGVAVSVECSTVPTSSDILTEAGDTLITEGSDALITE